MLQENFVNVNLIIGNKWEPLEKPIQSKDKPGRVYQNKWITFVKLQNPQLYGGVIGNLG